MNDHRQPKMLGLPKCLHLDSQHFLNSACPKIGEISAPAVQLDQFETGNVVSVCLPLSLTLVGRTYVNSYV